MRYQLYPVAVCMYELLHIGIWTLEQLRVFTWDLTSQGIQRS
jgi:hypothetical protein